MSTFPGNILRLTISGKDYVRFIVTHRVYACKRASASAWVISIHLSMDGFSSNLQWTYYKSHQVAWATYVSCSRTARTRASARVRPSAWLNIHLSMDLRFSNVWWTYYKSQQVAWPTYFSWSRALGKNIHSSLDGFSSNLLCTYYIWPQVTWATHLSSRTDEGVRVRAW
jgi:hypothetical protein